MMSSKRSFIGFSEALRDQSLQKCADYPKIPFIPKCDRLAKNLQKFSLSDIGL